MTLTARASRSSVRTIIQKQGLVLSLVLLGVALTLVSDRFLTVSNLTNVLRQSTINGIIAVGMTIVILTAGIDLSVGAILALTSVVTADLLQSGVPVLVAIVLGLLAGFVIGGISGMTIAKAKVPPFVATLGMMTIARGLALVYTDGRPITGLPDSFRWLGTGSIGPIPAPVIIAAATFLAGWILLHRSALGRYIYAIGDNPVAARFSGIRSDGIVTLVYALAGFFAALAGFILIARLDSAQPTAGIEFEFNAIAAVVVGGTSFAGGSGRLSGTLVGVLIIEVINNGLNLMNVSSFYQPIVTGVVIAVALLFQRGRST